MKKIVYRSLYKILLAISGKINNRYINHYKLAVGTTLILLTSGCQAPKKNNKIEDNKDSIKEGIYTDSILEVDTSNILCYDYDIIDTTEMKIPPPPPPTVDIDIPEETIIMCYEPAYIEDPIPVDTNAVYQIAEHMPEFPGGTQALVEFIKNNIYYPEEYGDIDIQGRVIAQFIIERDGSISDPQIIRGIDPKLDKIALEIINKLPNFTPALQNGERVRVKYTVPVTFKMY